MEVTTSHTSTQPQRNVSTSLLERDIPLQSNATFGLVATNKVVFQPESRDIKRELVVVALEEPVRSQREFLALVVEG